MPHEIRMHPQHDAAAAGPDGVHPDRGAEDTDRLGDLLTHGLEAATGTSRDGVELPRAAFIEP